MKKFTLKVWAIILLSFLGLASANAQFLENTETVDIVQIPGFDDGGKLAQYYVADLGTTVDSIAWTTATGDVTKWYKIPAGGVSDSTTNVQAYYYKNVATGRYLYISDAVQASLTGQRTGDWPTARAGATATNGKTANFKWFDRASPWPWGVYITNAAGIDPTQADGNRVNSLTGIILMKVNETGTIVPTKEFFGVYVPNVSVGGFKGGTGNAWTAVKTPVVVEAGALNPDVPHYLKNTKTVNVVQISTWMTPNNVKLNKVKPYAAANKAGAVVYMTDAASDSTKWYEIPAGAGAFENQIYYYKNVATGAYLKGSTRTPGEGGDWTVSAASTSATNNASDSLKWSKMNSNWGNGPWLVNEQGNTGKKPSGDNKNAFFALTMLTANSEFFGVDVPNVAISNPHDGGNAWTAVEIKSIATANNPDYFPEKTETVNIVQISTWMTPNNAKLNKVKPYAADKQGSVIYVTAASSDSTKWYEIPAGVGAFNNQVYYYKNLVTGAYLKGSTRTPGEGGDWTVSAATTSTTNDGSALYKWSKMNSNWGNGPWLVNEQGNTGKKPSGSNKNAFFALTMLTANSEFFGVDVPNVAISNPHDGGNAWTAVEINTIATNVANPDVKHNLEYSINKLNFFATDNGEDATASSYNTDTHTITYKNGGWHRAGWNWEADGGIDVSVFNQVWIKFDASALPKTGDGVGGATKIQFDVVYMDDTNAASLTSKSNETFSNDTAFYYNLTAGKKIKRITLKSQAEGDVVLKNAYFFHRAADPVDLVITNLSWTPANPVTGDSVAFKATIKNKSAIASQNVKHGVAFSINGAVVTWSDTHLTALAAGEEVTLTANGGSPNGKWKIGKSPFYLLKAVVNDSHDVIESDYTNNTVQDTLWNAGKPDLVVTAVAWNPTSGITTGSQITFNAKVKNIGNVDTRAGVKHGVAFLVDGNVVNWSDTRVTAIAANEEVRLTANSGPTGVAKWTVTGGNHTVTAHVNDQKDLVESDYTNNTLSAILNISTGILEIAPDGRIYVNNGKLYIINFPESTVVSIYNLQAQEIGHYRASEVSGLALPNNLYVLRIQDGDKSSNLKVLIK